MEPEVPTRQGEKGHIHPCLVGILPYWWPEVEQESSCAALLGSAPYVGKQVGVDSRPLLGVFAVVDPGDAALLWPSSLLASLSVSLYWAC